MHELLTFHSLLFRQTSAMALNAGLTPIARMAIAFVMKVLRAIPTLLVSQFMIVRSISLTLINSNSREAKLLVRVCHSML